MHLNHPKTTSPTPAAAAAAKSLQSCLTLCDPVDRSPPGSPIPPTPSTWKNCLPRNGSPGPRRLGTADSPQQGLPTPKNRIMLACGRNSTIVSGIKIIKTSKEFHSTPK